MLYIIHLYLHMYRIPNLRIGPGTTAPGRGGVRVGTCVYVRTYTYYVHVLRTYVRTYVHNIYIYIYAYIYIYIYIAIPYWLFPNGYSLLAIPYCCSPLAIPRSACPTSPRVSWPTTHVGTSSMSSVRLCP